MKKHNVDFLQGMKFCEDNSERLATSGRIILHDSDGTDQYGLFLLYIAYEELAKAVFCFFIHKNWVPYDFVKTIFEQHETKIFILDEILYSFSLNGGELFLGGKKMGDITLDEFITKHKSIISSHREDSKKFLYVEPSGNNWHVPTLSVKKIKERQENITNRLTALHTLLHTIRENSDKFLLNNFQIIVNSGGFIKLQYDTL